MTTQNIKSMEIQIIISMEKKRDLIYEELLKDANFLVKTGLKNNETLIKSLIMGAIVSGYNLRIAHVEGEGV